MPTEIPPSPDASDDSAVEASAPTCILTFNASDASGAGGLAGDVATIAAMGAHALPVIAAVLIRDTAEIFDQHIIDAETVVEQARCILEDVTVAGFKVGFLGNAENISAVAEVLSDYAEVPLVSYLPALSWLDEDDHSAYLDAFRELILPATEVLVGSHKTLIDFLLPDWDSDRPASPRELAVAAAEHGTRYVLVTGVMLPPAKGASQFIDNVLASEQGALTGEKFEMFEATFVGAGDTLSAAMAALLGATAELQAAVGEALQFLDQSLDAGFRPGMGGVVPDRFFWALPPGEDDEDERTIEEALSEELPEIGARAVSTNAALFERAQQVIPGGVNSPVRAFRAVGGTPRFIARAAGPYMWDVQGQRYIDYIGSWGPMILGHTHPAVLDAVQRAARDGFSFGAPTAREIELAEEIIRHVPSMEQLRLVSSGTEAAMSAIRLARAATGRARIIKFEGCYHGHADALLVKAGSGLATFGYPTSAGVPEAVVQHTLVLDFNDLDQLEQAFAQYGDTLACAIIEPIAGNMNFVRASVPFMRRLRELCHHHGCLLILDEVMTGFRVALGGAQSLYARAISGFAPDISVFGKVIGGGMPLAAFGASRQIMSQLAPLGPAYQAGTLSGNPIATACGLATLHEIAKPGFYEALGVRTRQLVVGLKHAAETAGAALAVDYEGGMFGFFFAHDLPTHYASVLATDQDRFNQFFHAMLEAGVYFAPALYEAGFVSAAHSPADIDYTLQAAAAALARSHA